VATTVFQRCAQLYLPEFYSAMHLCELKWLLPFVLSKVSEKGRVADIFSPDVINTTTVLILGDSRRLSDRGGQKNENDLV